MRAVIASNRATVTARGTITVLISALPTGESYRCTGSQVHRFTGSQVHRFTGAQKKPPLCTCVPVYLCSCSCEPLWHAHRYPSGLMGNLLWLIIVILVILWLGGWAMHMGGGL